MTLLICDDSACKSLANEAQSASRLIESMEIRFSEIIGACSVALDITQGLPEGHCMRTALIGMRLAEELKLPPADRSALFYALLLKDLGCSSNAAKTTYLFGADDHAMKRNLRTIDWTRPGETLKHCWKNCAPDGSIIDKVRRMASILTLGQEGARKFSTMRCERGADIARTLRLPEPTARAIFELDEHWNGQGVPMRLKGHEISLLARICCLSQTVEVFFSTYGLDAAIDMARQRRAKWFDPDVVDALLAIRNDTGFWSKLLTSDLTSEIARWEPEELTIAVDEESIDRVADAFARVVDAKSPWTFLHSSRVAEIAVGIARQFGCSAEMERDLHRAALLHDIGKLGVSNTILDKPGKPTDEEFIEIKKHPDYSMQILQRVSAFKNLAEVAGSHHERIDGRGYHRRLDGSKLPWIVRVLTIADMYEAMSARRPYRDAMSWEQIRGIFQRDLGKSVDAECFEALGRWVDGHELKSRVEDQLTQVDRLLSEL